MALPPLVTTAEAIGARAVASFDGKVAVVTGASKGIGLAVAQGLAAGGARVVAGARSFTRELANLERSADVTSVAVDLTAPRGPQLLVDAALELGGVDILINNLGGLVGRTPRFAGFLSVSDDDWYGTLELNLLSTVRAVRAVVPSMLERGGGVIVNVSSVMALLPDPSVVDYAASKAAVTNLSKGLSAEFAPQGIRVNTVSPGPVATSQWSDAGGLGDQMAAALGTDICGAMNTVAEGLGGIKLGRFGTPEDIANLVLFLASDSASWMTGANVVIDGGLVRTL